MTKEQSLYHGANKHQAPHSEDLSPEVARVLNALTRVPTPEYIGERTLPRRVKLWFAGMGISEETLKKAGVSARIETAADGKREYLVEYPRYMNHPTVHESIRYSNLKGEFFDGPGKRGLVFNVRALDDENEEIILTDGELNVLALMEAGYDNVIGVTINADGEIEMSEELRKKIALKKVYYYAFSTTRKLKDCVRGAYMRISEMRECLSDEFKPMKERYRPFLISEGCESVLEDLMVNGPEYVGRGHFHPGLNFSARELHAPEGGRYVVTPINNSLY